MFQSTHPRGVRRSLQASSVATFCFNPRTHEGCDLKTISYVEPSFVSIHAPTRGATFKRIQKSSFYLSFNPRTHEGCDIILLLLLISLHKVSIHAPTRGATAYSAKYRILIYKSSHFANINQTITFKVIKSLEFL